MWTAGTSPRPPVAGSSAADRAHGLVGDGSWPVDLGRCPSFTESVQSTRRISLLCFERVSAELARVLVDAACSFVAVDGHYHLASMPAAWGVSPDATRLASAMLLAPGPGSSRTTIDLGAGRESGVPAELANPIKLLFWLVAQPAAVDFHPTVNAYIGSSDPDDILPYLPFHPAPGAGGHGSAVVVADRRELARASGRRRS